MGDDIKIELFLIWHHSDHLRVTDISRLVHMIHDTCTIGIAYHTLHNNASHGITYQIIYLVIDTVLNEFNTFLFYEK